MNTKLVLGLKRATRFGACLCVLKPFKNKFGLYVLVYGFGINKTKPLTTSLLL